MDRSEINLLVNAYVKQSQAGQVTENSKFDFKAQWYNLTDHGGINEFLKDSTAIANTVGPDGFIVIGFDDKSKKFTDTVFKDCGMKDSYELAGLLSKRIDRIFQMDVFDTEIDGHKLSIIHIPPSLDKPHVIKEYRKNGIGNPEHHKIFVRHLSTTKAASKYDLDVMYYDRKNIQPDYQLESSLNHAGANFQVLANGLFRADLSLTFENIGRRPVAISEIEFKLDVLSYSIITDAEEKKSVDGKTYFFFTTTRVKRENILIQSGEILTKPILFTATENLTVPTKTYRSEHAAYFASQKHLLLDGINLKILLSNGSQIYSTLVFTNIISFNKLTFP